MSILKKRYINLSHNLISSAIKSDSSYLVVCNNDIQTQHIQNSLLFYGYTDIAIFPSSDILPFDNLSISDEINSKRLELLTSIPNHQPQILIINEKLLFERLPSPNSINVESLILNVGEEKTPQDLIRELEKKKYLRVKNINNPSEYSVKGGIIDIFPSSYEDAFRIEFDFDNINSINILDNTFTKSIKKVNEINILPKNEYIFSSNSWDIFKENYSLKFNRDLEDSRLFNDVKNKTLSSSFNNLKTLFMQENSNILEYLSPKTQVITSNILSDKIIQYEDYLHKRYEYCLKFNNEILPVHISYWPSNQIHEKLKSFSQIVTKEDSEKDSFENIHKLTPLNLSSSNTVGFKNLISDYERSDKNVIFISSSKGRSHILRDLISSYTDDIEVFDSYKNFQSQKVKFGIIYSNISYGLQSPKLDIVTEYELFGHKPKVYNQKQKSSNKPTFKNPLEINPNELIIHIEHGVCKYLGLETIQVNQIKQDYLSLLFAKGTKIFLPVTSINLVSKFKGKIDDNSSLSELGSSKWKNQKNKVAKQIKEVAAHLLDIQAKRAQVKKTPYDISDNEFAQFISAFPYEDTQDQLRVTSEIFTDLCSQKIMDRLLCGDVGFGKTEIAMRAAYLAVKSNKQVALIAPTTILVSQHYKTFEERFAEFNIKVAAISSSTTTAQRKDILQNLLDNKIQILVGTQSILNRAIKFKDLDLLIIDEEHRFGVSQKEKMKQTRSLINVLSMTATPIPRTLNMAIHGIRDLSMLTSPPKSRLPIKTSVIEFDKEIIGEAITREVHRGGQVFFLHNSIATIESMKQKIEEIAGSISIDIAHGGLSKDELETRMENFYRKKTDLLICTTIIETGIDVKSANTIIINDAHKLGIAQLYQIRGRIGRSNIQAYAYMVSPPKKVLQMQALQRMEAIQNHSELGHGFNLASQDLDIRGAGSILGEEQSGNINKIGFDLYLEILGKAIKSLESGNVYDETALESEIEMNSSINSLIPEEYINDINKRLEFYKRISSSNSFDDLTNNKLLMADIFGKVPVETLNLINTHLIKITATTLGCKKIDLSETKISFKLLEKNNIDANKVLEAMKNFNIKISPNTIKLIFKNNWFKETMNFLAYMT